MIDNIDSLWLFPLAFTILVLQKTYSVAKSAVVPALVRSEHDLVGANSRLALISAVSGMVGATVSGVLSLIGGPAFAAAVDGRLCRHDLVATKIPRTVVAAEPAEEIEKAELRDAHVLLAAYATAILEGSSASSPSCWPSSSAAARKGSTSAPSVRRRGSHRHRPWDRYLRRSRCAGVALRCRAPPRWHRCVDRRPSRPESARAGGRGTHAADGAGDRGCRCVVRSVLQRSVRRCRAVVRDRQRSRHRETAFDSLVQRAAPDANYGRSFARFEARFQGAWVIGAFVPAVIPLNLVVGGFGVAAAAIFALASYLIGKPAHEAVPWSSIRTLRPKGAGGTPPPPAATVADSTAGSPSTNPDHAETDPAELTIEDLRPSQPEAPAGTADFAYWWGNAEPIISSVDGVEVDPIGEAPRPPERPDDTDDSAR